MKDKFAWGVATASYQIEGAYNEDGKGENIWDASCKIKGNIFDNQNGNVSCDHYHRYVEDVKLLSELNVNSYRLSINWARILPNGIGKVNEKGLKFYSDLIDELLKANITPYVTLFHWDYPQALQEKGGWLNPDSDKWFEEYASVVANLFKGRVFNYFTFNEPQCIVDLGYKNAIHAPFQKLPLRDCMNIAHSILKANGRAVKCLKKIGGADVKVGMAVCALIKMPTKPEDEELAYRATFEVDKSTEERHFWSNTIFTQAPILGVYPQDVLDFYDIDFNPSKEDMDLIKCDLDFYGANIYSADYIVRDGEGYKKAKQEVGAPHTDMNWSVTPESLYYGSKFLARKYGLPIMITENGVALTEWLDEDGKLNDTCRIDFMSRYLKQIERALKENIDIRGYFYWSFLDNFEWALGYAKRFGLVHIDYNTLKRTPKQSYYWYQNFLKNTIKR